jgi:hypothetical protein
MTSQIFPEQSPFEQHIMLPYQAFFQPLSDVVYLPVKKLGALLDRPDD